VKKVVEVMVGFEDVYLANAYLLPLLREVHGEKIDDLQIATISDIDTVGTLLAYGDPVGVHLIEKVTSRELAEWSLGVFLEQKRKDKSGRNPVLQKGYVDFMRKITGKDFESIAGDL
jgi:hypothetical protein